MSWLIRAGYIAVNQSMDDYANTFIKNMLALPQRGIVEFSEPKILMYDYIEYKNSRTKVISYLLYSQDFGGYAYETPTGSWALVVKVPKSRYSSIEWSDFVTKKYVTIKSIILHELIHCIDPKLSSAKNKIKNEEWFAHHNKPDDFSDAYLIKPWEQDAYITSTAWAEAEELLRDGLTFEDAKRKVRNFTPEMSFSEFKDVLKFYFKHPKIKRKFLKAFNDSVDAVYGKGTKQIFDFVNYEINPDIASETGPVADKLYNYALMNKTRLPKQYESKLIGNPQICYFYALNIIKGRFEEGEPTISRHPTFSALYATEVLKDRFPMGENAISQKPELAKQYMKIFKIFSWEDFK